MKTLPETLPSESFKTQFQIQIGGSRFKDARKALNRLVEGGCEASTLLASVEVYCGHLKQQNRRLYDIKESVRASKSLVANAEKLAADLTENANRIERINREAEVLRELTWNEEEHRLNQLPVDLRSYASWLNSVAERIRPFSLRDQPGQVIRFAADYIKRFTGKDRPGDLTQLVRAGYAALGIEKDVDALDKIVRQARQRMKKSDTTKTQLKVSHSPEFDKS